MRIPKPLVSALLAAFLAANAASQEPAECNVTVVPTGPLSVDIFVMGLECDSGAMLMVNSIDVDWGDGNSTSHAGNTASHTYAANGIYQIEVEATGDCGGTPGAAACQVETGFLPVELLSFTIESSAPLVRDRAPRPPVLLAFSIE